MADISFTDMATSAGTTTGNWVKDIANGAADFACGLYMGYPDWVATKLEPAGIHTGFGDGLMRSLCAPRPGYVAPTRTVGPAPTPYDRCAGRWDFNTQNNGTGTVFGNTQPGTGNDKPYVSGQRTVIMGQSGVVQYTDQSYSAGQITISNIVYTPADANCNQPNPVPPPPPPPPANQLNKHTTVNNISVPITYVNADASFGIKVNVGGINVRFDHNGATLNDNSDNSTNNLNYNGSLNISAQTTQTAIAVANINNNLNTLVFAPSTLVPTANNPGQGATKTAISGMRIATITLTRFDLTASSKFGGNNFEIYQAGYFRFKRGIDAYPNEPIRYAHNVFVAPPGADGYAYNLYGVFEGFATEYTL